MFIMPLLFILLLLRGTPGGYTGNVPGLLDGERSVEEEVGLPVLVGAAVGGED